MGHLKINSKLKWFPKEIFSYSAFRQRVNVCSLGIIPRLKALFLFWQTFVCNSLLHVTRVNALGVSSLLRRKVDLSFFQKAEGSGCHLLISHPCSDSLSGSLLLLDMA